MAGRKCSYKWEDLEIGGTFISYNPYYLVRRAAYSYMRNHEKRFKVSRDKNESMKIIVERTA